MNYVKDILANGLGLDTRITTLGHLQRGGPPCAYDRMLATIQGYDAVEAVLQMDPQKPSPMIAITENKLTRKPLMDAVAAVSLDHQKITSNQLICYRLTKLSPLSRTRTLTAPCIYVTPSLTSTLKLIKSLPRPDR